MRATLSLGRRRMTWLGRLGWGAALALLGMALSIAAWDFVTGLIARNPSLGWVAGGLLALVGVACLGVALREWMGFRRLARLDDLRQQADRARNDGKPQHRIAAYGPPVRALCQPPRDALAPRQAGRTGPRTNPMPKGCCTYLKPRFWCHWTKPPEQRSRPPRGKSRF